MKRTCRHARVCLWFVAAIAAGIEALLADGERRGRMGQAATLRATRFDRRAAAFRLAALFETAGDRP